jgi:formate dehydrogenase major subunit
MTLGSGAMTNTIPEIGQYSDVIFIIGSNTAECHSLIARQVIKAKERGAKLIVADPRRTEMANKADLWLRVPSGYNLQVINAMMNVIIKERLYKEDFVKEHVEGFEDLALAVEDYTPADTEAKTGIPQADIVAAARLYARAGAAAILYSMGVTQFGFGTGTVVDLSNLAVITGNLGRPGTGICPLRGQNNVQGACDVGCLPNVFPGYQSVTVDEIRSRYENLYGVTLPSKPGLKVTEIGDAILDGRVKVLYVFGENPLMSDPDSDHFRHALEHLELLVVQDIFLTETARLADVVLPAACWGEKEGTFTNTERRVQLVRKAIDPPGEARDDWWIFGQLAKRMGYNGLSYNNPQEVWDEIRKGVKNFAGITYARLAKGSLVWPCPSEDHPGTPILYQGGKFSTPSGKAALIPVLFDPVCAPKEKAARFAKAIVGSIAERPDAEYPFVLTTGRTAYQYHTGTMTRKSTPFNQIGPQQMVEIHPRDAKKLGLRDGDFVKLSSRRGSIAAKAWVTERVPENTIFTTFHYWEACVNELTNTATDPIAGIPEFKVAAVKAEKISAAEAGRIFEEKRAKYLVDVEKEVDRRSKMRRVVNV